MMIQRYMAIDSEPALPRRRHSGRLCQLIVYLTLIVSLSSACSGTPSSPTAGPVLLNASPAAASIGTQVVLAGENFTPGGNHVKLGLGYVHNLVSPDSRTLLFVVPNSLSPCAPQVPVCTLLAVLLQPGDYPLSVINDRGTSNAITLTVVAP